MLKQWKGRETAKKPYDSSCFVSGLDSTVVRYGSSRSKRRSINVLCEEPRVQPGRKEMASRPLQKKPQGSRRWAVRCKPGSMLLESPSAPP
jgi:hypothetical protein